MGYTLTIGNAVFETWSDDKVSNLFVNAELKALDSAPTFPNDEMTGNGNQRSPSYTGWANFCREAKIYDLFFGNSKNGRYYETDIDGMHRESPLICDHPGFEAINKHDVAYVKSALDRYGTCHPDTSPGFDNWDPKEASCATLQDSTMARLMWLHFWMDWAVENCDRPIIKNT